MQRVKQIQSSQHKIETRPKEKSIIKIEQAAYKQEPASATKIVKSNKLESISISHCASLAAHTII